MASARTRRIARLTLRGALAVVLSAGVAVTLLSITPPQPVARQILLAVSDKALFAPAEAQRARYALHKIVGMYLEYTIAGKMARTADRRGIDDDVARMAFILGRARLRMLSAAEIPHTSQDWPVLVAGVGYCDQVNGAVARILAHSFPHAQLYALRDPLTGTSPHTIGRVWSKQRNEWLYFDGFGAQVVFRKTADGIEILSNAGASPNAATLRVYEFPGAVLNEYPPTFPAFLASTVRKRWSHEPEVLAPPPPPQTASAAVAETAPAAAAPQVVDELMPPALDVAASHRVAQTYVRARADDLFGNAEEAKRGYRAVAVANGELDPMVKILQAAAQRFGQPR